MQGVGPVMGPAYTVDHELVGARAPSRRPGMVHCLEIMEVV